MDRPGSRNTTQRDHAGPIGPRGMDRGGWRYVAVCAGLGLVLGWLPWLLHGPVPMKFAVHYIHGQIAVSAFYVARLSIGVLVGVTAWPPAWWLRGPLCGLLLMLPVSLVSLATPGCGQT